MKKLWNEARLSDKILVGLLSLVVIGWSVTAIRANTANENTAIEPKESQTEKIQMPDMITAIQAREIAVELVGDGVVSELNLNTDEEIPTFLIIVDYGDQEFQVVLNAIEGRLISLEVLTTSLPETGDLTAEEAIEIAGEHLVSIGISDATLVYSYSDIESGISVWSIEFRYNGRDLEFYVVKETGEFLKSPTALNGNSTTNSSNTASTLAPDSSSIPAPIPVVEPTPSASNNSSSSSSSSSTSNLSDHSAITRERAGEIALGISGGRLVEVSRSSHRGNAAWWVETRADGMVHEFYIDMYSSTVLQHEVEIDD